MCGEKDLVSQRNNSIEKRHQPKWRFLWRLAEKNVDQTGSRCRWVARVVRNPIAGDYKVDKQSKKNLGPAFDTGFGRKASRQVIKPG